MKKKWYKQKRWYLIVFAMIYFSIMIYHQYKPLPEGISYRSEVRRAESVKFYRDLTYTENGERTLDHQIFERVYEMIGEAEDFIVIDMFMMDGRVSEKKGYPDLSGSLMNELIEKKEKFPEMPIIFITDPFNTGYGSYEGAWLEPMKDAGIDVVISNLDPLRDPTPLYSSAWRMGPKYFGQSGTGWIMNPFVDGGPEMTFRSYLALANVKANHRKAVITDQSAMVLSANAHNESGFHNNVAYEVSGPVIEDMLEAEAAVARMSGYLKDFPEFDSQEEKNPDGPLEVTYTTEGETLSQVLDAIGDTESGDEIWLAMFYLSEPNIVDALINAANNGVKVSFILDPNETAFGNKKTGLPNRPVINEMNENSDQQMNVRWYNVDIEQYHPKMMYIKAADEGTIISGSANFTMRNMKNYNLENNITISGPLTEGVMIDTEQYFNRLWNNEGAEYTVPLEEYQDTLSFWQRGVYWLQKSLKLTTY
ncbi:phospholipase D-like domain-containing protein [Jeotgalibacillus haloalkalitolerans]|uniref:phospholipase D n=1 Tax=Jeotgalibacillus haloalkalitolerans TaxID=3104292 RepID=A0ABU5KKP5_9BACL|nr:phospholipase D-like domain-containing protein [Jeotgalibacillus sp. HH7-29]MDZ5711834.1 phospholipase D-like domain-containing protein [Jeotgalibacillus sp. HH7-29]